MNRVRCSEAFRGVGRRLGLAVVVGLCATGLLLAENFVLPSLSSSPAASELGVGMEVGQQYPDVVLPTLDGSGPLSISHFRGRRIILFQFASW